MAKRSGRTIRQRLIWGNFIIGLFIVVAGGIALWQINRLTREVDTLQNANEQVTVALEVRQDSTEMIALISRLLPIEDATVFESEASVALDALRQSHAALSTLLTNTTPDRAEYSLMNGVSNSVESVINISETMIRQASNGQWPSVRVRLGVLLRDQQQLVNLVNQLVDLTKETEQAAAAEVASAKQAALLFPTLVILATLVLGVLLFWRTTQSIIRPVEQLTAGVTHLAAGSLDERVAVESVDELGQLAAAFNTMAERLQVSHSELEERIGERTRALQLTTEVSRRLSTILDQKQLVSEVVEQVQRAFNYYHVHIYLLDEAEENLIMSGGTGEAGQAMLASRHKIPNGRGLVGRAAVTGDVVLAPDVAHDEKWLPNPLLPDTRAEIAVPMAISGRILGVLDVQHDVVHGLTEEDASLLQSVANQVAIALRNARLYEQAQRQAEQEALINMIGQKNPNGHRHG
jgi:nitrate/nitrite-specific signal transduction histidine kinase